MNARVTIEQTSVIKRFSSPEGADVAMLRAQALHDAGLSTPVPVKDDDRTLRFPRIVGISGPDLLAALPDLLVPLIALHRLVLPVLGLRPFDPLARIRPRLVLAPEWLATFVEAQAARVSCRPHGLCHGDFHPAQVIRDMSNQSWLIDLDDLALGPVEADLGNLIAWLATRTPADELTLAARHDQARTLILRHWRALGCSADLDQLETFTTMAICRRALKHLEHKDPSLLQQLEIYR